MVKPAASIWFKSGRSWIRVYTISIFSGNCSFTAGSGQIILFLFKSHHFRTYFLYMIRYNNISRPPRPLCDPPCDLPRPPAQNLWVATPQPPRIDAPGLSNSYAVQIRYKMTHGISNSVPETSKKNFGKLNISKLLCMQSSTMNSQFCYMNMC